MFLAAEIFLYIHLFQTYLIFVNLFKSMLKTPPILLIFFLILFASSQRVGVPPCPLVYSIGSVISARITIAQQKGIVPLIKGQDVQCYNYSLPYPFARVPEIAIAIHDFEAMKTDDLFFSIKPTKTQSLSFVPLLVRTHWKYTEWKKISFSILVQDRQDLESGYYQIDSGSLGGCEPGKTIHVLMPFRNSNNTNALHHNIFLHGFQISSQFYSAQERSPLEVQIVDTRTNSSGIAVFLSVTTITQVHAIHLSYVAWTVTDLNLVSGKYMEQVVDFLEISHIPEQNVGRNYARIFGLTGFVINNNNQQIIFSTHWSGSKFIYDFDVSTPFLSYISFEYIFFLGSECSDCPNYPFIFNGTCRQYCPEGYHATGEKVCIDCGEGHYWNGTACVKECPSGQFLNIANNECECPTGLHWNGARCISCVGGRVFNYEKNICECPEGTRWNGFGCATISVCKNGEEWNVFKFMCQCPLNSFWNGTYCVKVITCSKGQISDGKNGCVCPEGTHWTGSWCEAHGCSGGQIWNGSQCACEPGFNFNGSLCLLCINGQEWNPVKRTCDCPFNYVWNGNFCKKQVVCTGNRVWNDTVQQCLCPDKHFWNGFSCMVQPDCCCGQIWNQTSFQCNCPDNFNWDDSNCVLCLNGKVWVEERKTCDCREGTKWNGHFCVVTQECYGGTIWIQNTWSCQCPPSLVWNGNFCLANPCQGGQIWDGIKRRCLCPSGFQLINKICVRPQNLCNSTRVWSPILMRCVCPPQYWDNSVTCIPVPVCQGSQILNPLNNQCECPFGLVWLESKKDCGDPTCPADERWDGFACVKIQCPPNSYYNGTECVCPDPRDRCMPWEYYDGIQCVYQPGTCPSGTDWNGTFCISNTTCPVGFYQQNSKCHALPQRCIPPSFWNGGRCQVENTCPHGTYFRSGSCIPYVPCQNGQIWNDNTINCVCPEGTEWNGNKCLACSGGKRWEPFVGCVCPTGSFFTGTRCERVNEGRCILIPNALWDGAQCVCHEGFDVVGIQCVCDGVVTGNRCDRCAHRPNSEWSFGACRCKRGYTLYNGQQCLANQVGSDSPDSCNVATFYDVQQRRCLPCPTGCLTCESSYVCEMCKPEFNLDANSQLCSEHCGDGVRFMLECDDGNNIDGDGCSFECKVEPGYVCRGGSPNHPDSCIVYKPQQITIVQTGQIRYSTKMIVNVKLDYMPKELLQSPDCNDRCSNVLDGQLIGGDTKAISVRSSYLAGTSYSFSVEIEFGRTYIGSFTLQVRVNPTVAQKYFTTVGASAALQIQVNPALLAKAENSDKDYL